MTEEQAHVTRITNSDKAFRIWQDRIHQEQKCDKLWMNARGDPSKIKEAKRCQEMLRRLRIAEIEAHRKAKEAEKTIERSDLIKHPAVSFA